MRYDVTMLFSIDADDDEHARDLATDAEILLRRAGYLDVDADFVETLPRHRPADGTLAPRGTIGRVGGSNPLRAGCWARMGLEFQGR